MRRTHTWTISLPPDLSRLAHQLAAQEHRTKSELVRESLRLYLAHQGRPVSLGTGEHLARVGELAELYRQHQAPRRPTEAELRAQFRGIRRLHERLKHLTP